MVPVARILGQTDHVAIEVGDAVDVAHLEAIGADAHRRAMREIEGGQRAAAGHAPSIPQIDVLRQSAWDYAVVSRIRVPQGSVVSAPSAVVMMGAPAAWSRAFTASSVAWSVASNESQARPARSGSRAPAPRLCQTLAAIWW